MISSSAFSFRNLRSGFSLIEMLAAVAIIGIISFLALPNLIKMRSDSEKNMAIARAEAVNMAMATLVQTRGRTQAAAEWTAAGNHDAKYVLVAPYLSYAEATRAAYMPNGYTIEFPAAVDPLTKVRLRQGTTTINY